MNDDHGGTGAPMPLLPAPQVLSDNAVAADRLGLLRMHFRVTRDLFSTCELRRLEFVRRNLARYHEWEDEHASM
jgi:hypothetical protein